MNEFDKPPKILTIREISRKTGIPYQTVRYRKNHGIDVEENHRDKPLKALQGKTQSEVAREFGISRQRVWQRIKDGYVLDGKKWIK